MSAEDISASAAYERQILDRFGQPYFDGVRWGGGSSCLFLLDQARRVFRFIRNRHLCNDTKVLGLDEEFVRGRATVLRTFRRALSTEKVFLVGMVGLIAAAAHNGLGALLANLRVREFEASNDQRRLSPVLQSAPHTATVMPTFWDGFAVGCVGSIMDADLPQHPPHRYLGLGCGW